MEYANYYSSDRIINLKRKKLKKKRKKDKEENENEAMFYFDEDDIWRCIIHCLLALDYTH